MCLREQWLSMTRFILIKLKSPIRIGGNMKFGLSRSMANHRPSTREQFPDSLVWREELTYQEPYVEYYYRHPAYDDSPVVGIGYEQAAEYCKWRTAHVRQQMEADAHGKKILPLSINYRLPTKAEWEEVAKAGFSEKTLKQISKKKWRGVQLYNAIRYDSTYTGTGKINPDVTITAPVYMYLPNKLGIYNLFGNVGEMISEKGIYKGGGWNDKMNELKAERDYHYENPKASLGFRCACDVRWN